MDKVLRIFYFIISRNLPFIIHNEIDPSTDTEKAQWWSHKRSFFSALMRTAQKHVTLYEKQNYSAKKTLVQ